MKLIGLTGGIGCGKTTVVEELRHVGIPCFIADQHASELYEEADFVAQVCALLGNDIVDGNGQVDKRLIAGRVFTDRTKLLALNALVHPRVMDDFRRWAKRQTAPFVVIESAILYEYGLDAGLDAVIAVYVEKEERMRRLLLRDKVSREALEMRMANQLPAEEKMDRADYVILNYEGNPRRRQVETIVREVISES